MYIKEIQNKQYKEINKNKKIKKKLKRGISQKYQSSQKQATEQAKK